MKKMTVDQFRVNMAAVKTNTDRRATAKLRHPTSLDPQPTIKSTAWRAAAGSAGAYYTGLKAVARNYGFTKPTKGKPGFAFDLDAARELVTA